jgi:hypothetical protein
VKAGGAAGVGPSSAGLVGAGGSGPKRRGSGGHS